MMSNIVPADKKEPRPPTEDIIQDCSICKVLTGQEFHHKIAETVYWYAILDRNPLCEGHIIVFTKIRHIRFENISYAEMSEIGPLLKYIGKAFIGQNWNILLNNGRAAHQYTDHICFHLIPKPSTKEGLLINWWTERKTEDELALTTHRILSRLRVD